MVILLIFSYCITIMGLVMFIAAGILWLRTRTIPTAMFCLGLAISDLPFIVGMLTKLGLARSFLSDLGIFPVFGIFLQAIGLLLYSLSLPKKS